MSRIVVLARKLDQGGAERQLVALAKGLKRRGHDIQVLLFYSGGVYDAELGAAGVPVHFVGKRGRWDVIGFLVRLVLGKLCKTPPTARVSVGQYRHETDELGCVGV